MDYNLRIEDILDKYSIPYKVELNKISNNANKANKTKGNFQNQMLKL